jgi:hypothetical protein
MCNRNRKKTDLKTSNPGLGDTSQELILEKRVQLIRLSIDQLNVIDRKILSQIESIRKQNQWNFIISCIFSGILILLLLGILIFCLKIVWDINDPAFHKGFSVAGVIASILLIITIIIKNPLDKLQLTNLRLIQINMIYFGYLHRINQIEQAYHQILLDYPNFNTDNLIRSLSDLQNSIELALDEFDQMIEKV